MHFSLLYKSRWILRSACIVAGLVLCLFIFPTTTHFSDFVYDTTEHNIFHHTDDDLSCDSNPLCFIPQKTICLWNERDFLIVFGIPSLDIPLRRWRRRLQRTTFWQLPEVATRQNKYSGQLLPLYLLARHPNNNYSLFDVAEEAEQWHDVIIHPMSEGKITTNKGTDGKGDWGIEAQIGSGRKTYFWFDFALRQFPRVPFIGKGDDDLFLRVPQYLADLRRIPRTATYWGSYVGAMVPIDKDREKIDIKFILGFCMTLARDVAEQLVLYKPLKRLAFLPYSKKLEPEFIFLCVQNEDIMVGRVLKLSGYPFIFFADNFERFHIHPNVPLTENFVATHAPLEDEYYFLMKKILVNSTTSRATVIRKASPLFYFVSASSEK